MSVHYRFRSTQEVETVVFDGLHISVADLKKQILQKKRISKNADFDLQITNAQTKEVYTDDHTLIAKNTSLVVSRVPSNVLSKRVHDKTETALFNNTKDETKLGRSVDLTRLDGSEEDKIQAMITQSTEVYDPSNYMKIRGASQTGEVPPNYRCYKCHKQGHWIKNCPLGANTEPIEIKKSTGIPRSFMVPVAGPSVPGAMMTPGGTFAVPAIDQQAYKEGKKEKPPFSLDPQPVVEKPEIPEDLLCSLCKDLLTDAVMIPCCGNSFCDECIRGHLLESEDHECPDCKEKDVSPEDLIPNRYLRNAVLNFKNETGYAKRPMLKPMIVQKLHSELSISEKLNASPSMSAITPTQSPLSTMIANSSQAATGDAEKKEADKPIGDDEGEVPPPPGTEPALLPKRLSEQPWHERNDSGNEMRDEEYGRDNRYTTERKRSFSKDNHRDRNNYNPRMENNIRPMSRRRSLSPRNNSHEYPMHQTTGHKGYQDNRYHQAPVHYDPNLRRSTEDRAGTPTVDEPHLHVPTHGHPPPLSYPPGDDRNQPPPYGGPPQIPPVPSQPTHMPTDPYMAPPRIPMYSQPPGPPAPPPPVPHGYGPPPPPPQRYDGRPPPPSVYQQPGAYRPSQPPRTYAGGMPRPMRGMHNISYRGMQPPPPGMARNIHNGTVGVIDDPLEAFQRMLREKDERDRRLGKRRPRSSRSPRSRSRSYSRSRSRSPFARSPKQRPISRSRSPPPKRRPAAVSRSPPPLHHRARSRTPKKRRSRSGSFSISRSRSYSRSQSPRGPLPRDKDRERKGKRARDAPPPYRSPIRSPPRYHKERERDRDRPRSRESYASYYNDTAVSAPSSDYHHRPDRTSRSAYSSRGPPRSPPAPLPPLLPPPPNLIVAVAGPQVPSGQQPTNSQVDRKDYYDSYNRYPGAANQPASRFNKRFDDVAPPGTEGYYDLPPPGVDHLERPGSKDRPPTKDKDADRYKDERDRHRGSDDKVRSSRSDRRDRDYEHQSIERKRSKRSSSPYSSKHRSDVKEYSPDRSRKKDKEHSEKSDEKKKEKKIKEKKKKKDTEEKEKKKKKKKEKKAALIQKEAAAAAAINPVLQETNFASHPVLKVKQEPRSSDEASLAPTPVVSHSVETTTTTPTAPKPNQTAEHVVVKTEPVDEHENSMKPLLMSNPESDPLEYSTNEKSSAIEETNSSKTPEFEEPHKQETGQPESTQDSLYAGLIDESEITSTVPTDADNEETKTEDQLTEKEDGELDEDKSEEDKTILPSPKKDEFLAPLPELSKWERDETTEKLDRDSDTPERENVESEDSKNNKSGVTNEVLKRAENAIFQKAINAIRPIEIKKISESRKVLYQNPEPKVLEPEIERDTRKNVNVIINVNKNERSVELTTEPIKKSKSERTKRNLQVSPTRLSVKERLGEKIEDVKSLLGERRDSTKGENTPRDRTPRQRAKERIISIGDDSPIVPNPERKVYVNDRKRDRSRTNIKLAEESIRIHDGGELKKRERITRTPPIVVTVKTRKDDEEDKLDHKKDKKIRDERKRKKEHRSRSKSRDRKKRKEKKHKKEKEKLIDRRQKHSKEKDTPKEKSTVDEKESDAGINESIRKQKKNPKLAGEKRKSILDEANFEPDYSASNSESEEDKSTLSATKRAKLDESVIIDVDAEPTPKRKKPRPSSSEDEDSSSSYSSSSESESSVESHRKKKRKHKKRKKRKASKKDTSSDSDSESSGSSSEEEKHRKKKKSKSKNKASKKKKKSKHK